MKISKFLHSCIVLEKEGTRILFDPGSYCFMDGLVKPEEFLGLSALFITHNHADHYVPDAVRKIVEANPGLAIFTNPGTHALLSKDGIAGEIFHEGEKEIGSFRVKAIPAIHEKILFPIPDNTAYLVDDMFLHPGDSFDPCLHGLKPKVLALPTWAPWMTHPMMVEFVKGVAPGAVIPIHDWPLKDVSIARQNSTLGDVFKEFHVDVWPLSLGETREI